MSETKSFFMEEKPPLTLEPKKTSPQPLFEKFGYPFLFSYGLLLFFASFFSGNLKDILPQMPTIFVAPSPLITDYIALTSLGSAFFNAGLLTLVFVSLSYWQKVPFSGPLVASLFMVSGFSFFGKNLFNSFPLLLGTYLYTKSKKMPFRSYAIVGFFASSLSPVISMLAFGKLLPLVPGILAGMLVGILIGFILPPLATHFQGFTQGFNLYNVGFTSGMVSMLLTGIFRMFGWQVENNNLVSSTSDVYLTRFILLFASVLLLTGGLLHYQEKKATLKNLFQSSGKIVSDFIHSFGLGNAFINMGLMAFLTLGYVKLTGGTLNGPVFGTILSVIGFSAYGTHVMNSLPILVGAYLAGMFNIYDIQSTSLLLGALFSTTLSPIAGFYGIIPGILAGFFHIAMVMNIGYLHGGLNLYNNGFSGGFVAALMVPVLDSLDIKKRRFHFGRKLISKKNR